MTIDSGVSPVGRDSAPPVLAREPVRRMRAFARLLQIQVALVRALGVYLRERVRLRGKGAESRQRAAGRAALHLCNRLGATFIKIGQILSTRSDLFPQPLLDELAAVQDQVPPFSFEVVRKTIEKELGRPLEDVYDDFDETPVAAGSVAQVHRAILRATGDDVAVKIRRPDIRGKMILDRAVLTFGARMLERLSPSLRLVSAAGAVEEFCTAVEQQLDFVREAESNRRLREFAIVSKVYDYIIPSTFPAASSEAVLTMEWVEGLREHELPGSGIDLPHVIRTVVRGICRATFINGFVHADPHPGNIRFLPPGSVVLMDFGLIAELDPEERRTFARMVFAMATGDGGSLAKLHYEQAPRRDVRDYPAYEAEMTAFATAIHRRSLREFDTVRDIGRMFDILRRHRIQMRSNMTMVYVTLLAMEGLSKRLAPDVLLFDELLPYVAEGLELIAASPTQSVGGTPIPEGGEPTERAVSFGSGRYQIVRLLGEGARKRVYVAKDTTLARQVALSVLKSDQVDAVSLTRMTLEARAMAGLGDHPRIVSVYDFGQEDGRPYFVSELMAGGTLEEQLESREGGRLTVADAVRIAGQVCQALAHAHSRGILHCDVKPANVWLTGDGFAKLGDFGLATAPERMPKTPHRAIVGTVTYMAPEQALGKEIEVRSDLYSVGCLLYEMLTGEPPFTGDAATVLAHHLQSNPTPPSEKNREVPEALDALVMRCLAKPVGDRPASATELEHALAEIGAAKTDAAVLPESLQGGQFVGREQEMAQLILAFDDATRGRGRISLLAGEPGIGKTRTAGELGVHARRRGARVLLGRCHEGEGAPVFWPWVQILREYIQSRDPKALVVEAGLAAPVIAQLVPELRERIPGLEMPAAHDSEQNRFRLFDGITRFLKTAAGSQPLMLILDDLHWADKPSLLLLQFLAREIEDARILLVATYRDIEVQQGHPLAEILPSLRRASGHERIRLRGLRETEVRSLLNSRSGRELAPAIARTIHRETEGNPFFVGEVLSHLIEEGKLDERAADEIGIPESVRDVVSRRIGRLSEATRRALSLASVIGREFDLAVLERVANGEAETLENALAEATAAGVVAELPRSVGRYRFSHALIRETLYGDLRSTQRVGLHRKTANALEDVHGDRPGRHLSELAYHYAEAAPLGEVDKAVSYAIRAGEHAHAQLAFEESVRSYEQALECLALRETPSDDPRCELLLRLGEVRFLAGEFERSKTTFLEAATLAERIGDAEKLGAAALGYGGGLRMTFDSTAPTETLMTLFDKALKALEGADSALRAKIMVRRAVAMQTSRWTGAVAGSAPRHNDAEPLAREALAMAQRVGDREASAFVLGAAAWAIQSPESLAERLMLLDGALTVVRELKNPKFEIFIRMLLSQYHVETGDMDRAIAEAAVVEATPDAEHDPYVRWLITAWRASCAFLEGRADDAEKHIGEGLSLGEESGNRDALAIGYAQLMFFRFLQGRTDEALRGLVNLANRYSDVAYFRIVQIPEFAAFELFAPQRMSEEATASMRRSLASVLQQRILDRRLISWMAEACAYAEIAALLEDREAAAMLYEQLLPFENRCGTVARFLFIGSVARSLGVVATALDRFDDAERHFEAAMATNRRMRARPFVAYGAMNYATMLLKRAKPGDRERALALLGEAIDLLQQLPMKRFLEAAVALRLKAQGVGTRDVKGSIHAIADSIEVKKPDLSAHAAPDGTVTLLFSDVEGFSAMTDRLGDRRAHEIMREHHEIVRRELRAHGGYEVELMGDGFLLAFSSARRGLDCAIAIQKAFAAYNEKHPEEPLRVRMGLHTGEAIREAHKFFGKAVILAARIAAHARGGEILVSTLFHELTKSGSDVPFGPIREVELKGLAGAHGVCAVGWDGRVPEEIVVPDASPEAAATDDAKAFRRSGDFWTITFEGRSVTLRDAKGLNYLARLLAEPGREMHALDLIGGGNGVAPSGTAAKSADQPVGDLGSAGELLDPQARAEYRARLDELKSELDDAEGANDVGRAARLREEMEFLSQELSAAFGLGGRARKASDATERARKAVSGRINESIARIRKEHAALGAHLTNAIRLGTFCEYRPEKPTRWEL